MGLFGGASVAVVVGRLANDIEVKEIGEHRKAEFRVAVPSNKKDKETGKYKTDFIPCESWNYTADKLRDYAIKGKLIEAIGSLTTDSWKDKESGKQRSKVYVDVREVSILSSKDDGGGARASTEENQKTAAPFA